MSDFNLTRNPTALSSEAGGTGWNSVGNAGIKDNNFTNSDIDKDTVTQWLTAKGYGFTVESDATIVGIELNAFHSSENSSDVHDTQIFLIDTAGNNVGSNRATGNGIPTSDVWFTWGTPTDLWGTTWTPAKINHSNFGARLEYDNTRSSRRHIYVDVVTIKVYYTRPDVQGMMLQMGAF